jgi:hypothetical protein
MSLADDEHGRIRLAQRLKSSVVRLQIGDQDGCSARAQLLRHRIGPRRVVVRQEHAQSRELRGNHWKRGRTRVAAQIELVTQRLGSHDVTPHAPDETIHEFDQWPTLAEHQAQLFVVYAFGQEPARQPFPQTFGEHIDELVQRRFPEVTLRVSPALRDVARQACHLLGGRVHAGRSRQHGSGPMLERSQLRAELGVVVQHHHRDAEILREPPQLFEHARATIAGGIPHQQHEIRRGHHDRVHQAN